MPPATDPTGSPATEERQRLGELALERGLINSDQLQDGLQTQARLKELGLRERIGEVLLQKNFLTREALTELLTLQSQNKVRKLGNFEVFEKIGQGAMGVVFRARQISMDRTVALKILAPKFAKDQHFIKRFLREARAAGRLSHQNIVTALDVGNEKAYYYFAMEYVEGDTLARILKHRGALPEREALSFAKQIADALDHALRNGFIHRDVKPDNIMVTPHGTAKLLDLGLISSIEQEGSAAGGQGRQKSTAAGHEEGKAIGTPHYISPEAARGQADLDTRADIYSLGCTLFHALTGSTPFQGASSHQVMVQHLTRPLPDLRELRPTLSPQVAELVARMTCKNREERLQTPGELSLEIQRLLERNNPARPSPHSSSPEPKSTSRAHPREGSARLAGRTAATTGPRVPIKGGGTTGPRRPIQPRASTGPLQPIEGGRIIALNPTAAARRQAPPAAKWGALLIALALLGSGAVALRLRPASTQATPPAKAKGPEGPLPAASPGGPAAPAALQAQGAQSLPQTFPTGPASGRPDLHPVPAAPDLRAKRLAEAGELLTRYRALTRSKPQAFPQRRDLLQEAEPKAEGADLAREVAQARQALDHEWQTALLTHLQPCLQQARQAQAQGDFAGCRQLLLQPQIPEVLQGPGCQQVLEDCRKPFLAAAEEEAQGLLARAREASRSPDSSGLGKAQEILLRLGRIPSDWAPSATQAAPLAAEIATAQAALAAKGKEQLEALHTRMERELAPLLEQGRVTAALRILEEHSNAPEWASAKGILEREARHLRLVQRLRERALEALRAKIGETVTLHSGATQLSGKVLPTQAANQLSLKLKGGPEFSFHSEALEAGDVLQHAGPPPAGTEAADRLARGLLCLFARRTAEAKAAFAEAARMGLEPDVAPYLKRIAGQEQALIEEQAALAWAALQRHAEGKRYAALKSGLDEFSKQFGTTSFLAGHAKELTAWTALANEELLKASAPQDGLALWYRMEEGKGTASAAQAKELPALDLKGATWAPGRGGAALEFDGNGQYAVNAADVSAQFKDESVTLSLWVYPRGPGVVVDELGQAETNTAWHDAQIEILESGEVWVRVWPLLPVAVGKLSFEAWHHLALRYDQGTQTLDGFLDGARAPQPGKGARQAPWKQGFRLCYALGCADSTNCGSGKNFKGLVDDLRIYNRPLSDEEVKRAGGR